MNQLKSIFLFVLIAICFMAPFAKASNSMSAPPSSLSPNKNNDNDNDYDNNYDDNNDNDNDNDNEEENTMMDNPAEQLTTVAIDVHFISGNLDDQFIVYHYCSTARTGVIQCVLYDSDKKDARMIGIEDIITADVFAKLSYSEKQLWHSHSYAIKNGFFTIVGLRGAKENAVLQTIIDTYGKVVDIWDQSISQPRNTPRQRRVAETEGESESFLYVLVSWGRAVLEERDSPAINLQFSSAHALQNGKLCPSSDAESLVYLLYFVCGGKLQQQDSIESALQWRQSCWAKRYIQQRLGEVSSLLKAFADYIDSLCGTPYPVDYDIWIKRLNKAVDSSADKGKKVEEMLRLTDIAESSGTSKGGNSFVELEQD